MASKFRETLQYGLISLFLAHFPFSCKDYSIKQISESETQEKRTALETEPLDFEEELYQRRIKVRKEINLKDIKLCESFNEKNECKETDIVYINKPVDILSNFELIGLKGRVITQEIKLYSLGKENLLYSENRIFKEGNNLTRIPIAVNENFSPGEATLELLISSQSYEISSSLKREVKLKKYIGSVRFESSPDIFNGGIFYPENTPQGRRNIDLNENYLLTPGLYTAFLEGKKKSKLICKGTSGYQEDISPDCETQTEIIIPDKVCKFNVKPDQETIVKIFKNGCRTNGE